MGRAAAAEGSPGALSTGGPAGRRLTLAPSAAARAQRRAGAPAARAGRLRSWRRAVPPHFGRCAQNQPAARAPWRRRALPRRPRTAATLRAQGGSGEGRRRCGRMQRCCAEANGTRAPEAAMVQRSTAHPTRSRTRSPSAPQTSARAPPAGRSRRRRRRTRQRGAGRALRGGAACGARPRGSAGGEAGRGAGAVQARPPAAGSRAYTPASSSPLPTIVRKGHERFIHQLHRQRLAPALGRAPVAARAVAEDLQRGAAGQG